jgi:hypothetical protein
MFIRELTIDEATQVWSKGKGGGSVRKYRCTSGARKGRVMASPASCNKPLNVHKSAGLKKTRQKKKQAMAYRSGITKRSNPGAIRTAKLNKSAAKIRPRKSSSKRSRRMK